MINNTYKIQDIFSKSINKIIIDNLSEKNSSIEMINILNVDVERGWFCIATQRFWIDGSIHISWDSLLDKNLLFTSQYDALMIWITIKKYTHNTLNCIVTIV